MLPVLSGAGALLIYTTPEWISFNGYCFICLSILIVEAIFSNRFRRLVEIVESSPRRDYLSDPSDDDPVPEHPAPGAHHAFEIKSQVREIPVQKLPPDFSINIDDCSHGKLISLK